MAATDGLTSTANASEPFDEPVVLQLYSVNRIIHSRFIIGPLVGFQLILTLVTDVTLSLCLKTALLHSHGGE